MMKIRQIITSEDGDKTNPVDNYHVGGTLINQRNPVLTFSVYLVVCSPPFVQVTLRYICN